MAGSLNALKKALETRERTNREAEEMNEDLPDAALLFYFTDHLVVLFPLGTYYKNHSPFSQ